MSARGLGAFAVLIWMTAASAAEAAKEPGSPAGLRQYVSGGHVLGFDEGGYYVSNGSYALNVRFEGARPTRPQGAGDGTEPGSTGKAPALDQVVYDELWPGIRVTYDAPGSGIARSTWTLQPGADPGAIRLRYNRPVDVTEAGELGIRFETGAMTESRPIAWQDVNGRRVEVEVAFARLEDNGVGFHLGRYRSDLPLTIDPTLTWNTFLGSNTSNDDFGKAIAIDGDGNVIVAGQSDGPWGAAIRPAAGATDACVAKLSSSGTLLWNTFLGGAGNDNADSIAVDTLGNIYVVGTSSALWGTPVSAFGGGATDAFVARLEATGALTWNTFLGGSGSDEGGGIAVDSAGNTSVAGTSSSSWGAPLDSFGGGSTDAFAARLNSNGNLTWNTFLGGSGTDRGEAITVDGSGNLYVAGSSSATWDSPLRAYSGASDGFVVKLSSSGARSWNTFLGGTSSDGVNAIALDGSGNVFVAGSSFATWGSPVRTYASGSDAFAAKLNASGGLVWNTFLGAGSNRNDSGSAIVTDSSGNTYVAGQSSLTWGSPLRAYGGTGDGFVVKLSSTGSLTWSTFLGGTGSDDGKAIAADTSGNLYVTGSSSTTWHSPILPYSGASDAHVARLSSAGALTWNTFLGAAGGTSGTAVAVDVNANTYVAGFSYATWGSPLRSFSAVTDAFVAKLDAGGNLIWSTFLGGAGEDLPLAVAVDAAGSVRICGLSSVSWGSPLRAFGSMNDGFVARLDASGSLLWNTFLGGGSYDEARGAALDASGNVYIAGSSGATWGSPLIAFTGFNDGFAAKLSPTGTLAWHAFLGGSNQSSADAIAVDGSTVYVVGRSDSTFGSPVRAFTLSYDVFVTRLTSDGALTWNTFLGGDGQDSPGSMAVATGGDVYVQGTSDLTWGSPTRSLSGGRDVFVAKLGSSGTLSWSTFLGSSTDDDGSAIAADSSGDVYVAGRSDLTWGTPLAAITGGSDAFVARLSSSGAMVWNTFIGGTNFDSADAITVEGIGNVYVAGSSRSTWGMPVRPYGAPSNAFVALIADPPPSPTPTLTPTVTPTDTATQTPTDTPTFVPTHTPTRTPTGTPTALPTDTPTMIPTDTPSATPTATLAAGCPPVPEGTCYLAARGSLSLKRGADPSRFALKWKWSKGGLTASQSAFGDPVGGSPAYTLCLYDQTGSVSSLKMGMSLAAGGICSGDKPCWKALSDKGWAYKNKTGNDDGLTQLKFKGGDPGRPSLQVSGKGASLPLPAPFGPTELFDQDTEVVIQLHASDPDACWSSTFLTHKKNDGESFKAALP